MPTCRADSTIERVAVGEFKFPLGVYPVEDASPRPGFIVEFEPADGGEMGVHDDPHHDSPEAPRAKSSTPIEPGDDDSPGEWEEWPDRYVFDIVVSAERLEPLCRRLFSLLPGRIYPILDVLGRDAYREIDPYISYDLIGLDKFLDTIRRYRDFFYEDGMCGFGAMSESPFVYVFVDEHKIATVRVEPEMKERVEKLLAAFDLHAALPGQEPAGADSSAHEHRTVLAVPDDAPNLLSPDEIVEELREHWRLLLNIDPESNLDEEGHAMGVTPWRCIVRCEGETSRKNEDPPRRYAEVVLEAPCLRAAEDTAFDAVETLWLADETAPPMGDVILVAADRLTPEGFKELLAPPKRTSRKGSKAAPGASEGKSGQSPNKDDAPAEAPSEGVVHLCRWLDEASETEK